jgi:hypothetical protein
MRTAISSRTAALALTLIGLTWSGAAHAGNVCRASSLAENQACRNDGTSTYFTTTGNCLNLGTLAATQACKKAAKHDLADAKGEYTDQLNARYALCAQLGKAPYDPAIDPASFLSPSATSANPNQFFPLVIGTVWTYKGGGETDVVTVTNATRVIAGVTTIAVHDVSTDDASNLVTEDTTDYFAQQTDGTVWYFGESSKQLENGDVVGVEGSFLAGVDHAKPGIIMKATPKVGDVYRQEFALGVAEDSAEVLSTTATESVPAASCNGTCLETHDFSPLEPDANEQKFYAPGIGDILEIDVAAGGTRLELVSVTH